MDRLTLKAGNSDLLSAFAGKLQHDSVGSSSSRITLQWKISLDTLIQDLDKLPALTELRFLKVGSMLQEISSGLGAVAESAETAAGMMSGEEATAVIGDLERLLDRADDDYNTANRSVSLARNLLVGILGELRDMERLMESFKGHVGNLRMLKLLTNIQGASLAERGAGFRNVATDIGALSQNVQVKSTAILARIKVVRAQLARGQTMVFELGAAQQQLNGKLVEGIRQKIAIMADMNAKCSDAARNECSRTGDISRDIGAIVVAMQFQDITRQQIEHAREALAGVRKRVASEGPNGCGGMPADEIAGICALQSAQLSRTADDLMAAVNGITSGLQGVSLQAAALSEGAHGLFRTAEGVGRSSLAEIESSLASLLKMFGEKLAIRQSLAEVIRSTTLAMGEITGFAEEIDYLGSEIRLIALNAIVKALQAGREGAGFGVIAESVKEQSDEICRQAAAISTAIHAITVHVAEMRREVLGEADGSEVLHADELSSSLDRLKRLTNEAGEQLLRADKQAASLAETIDQAAEALNNEEIATHVRHDLNPRLERLTAGLGRGGRSGDGQDLKGAELRYTMGSEREVHRRFVLGEQPLQPMKGAEQVSHVVDAHFGSNVELF